MKYFLIHVPFCLALLFSCHSSNQKTEGGETIAATVDTLAIVEDNPSAEAPVERVEVIGKHLYKGTINNNIEIKLTLTFDNDVIYGNVVYKKSGKPITLIGYRDDENNIYLNEFYQSKEITGIYSGKISSVDSISGDWYGGNYEVGKAFVIHRTEALSLDVAEFKEDFTGNYAYHYAVENGANGSMSIEVKDDSISYSFDCTTSGPAFNIASLMATSKLNKNHVKYSDQNENGRCAFEIYFVPGGAFVRHTGLGFECGFGMNAQLGGCYFKEDNVKPDWAEIEKEYSGR
jgi:hypothetical protein